MILCLEIVYLPTNLMRAKGDVGIISDIISEAKKYISKIIVKLTLTNYPLQDLIHHMTMLNMDTVMRMIIVTSILMMQ